MSRTAAIRRSRRCGPLTEKVASSPQAASAIAAAAKKLFDDKATKGGIVLVGMVTGLAAKNGLCGTAIRMEGMDKPVRIFSAHPLGVKEDQKVIVLGALVADPAKNLPGYPGQPARGRVGRLRHGHPVTAAGGTNARPIP